MFGATPIKHTTETGISYAVRDNLRNNIGYVSQEMFLFDGTLKDNIAYPPNNINNDRLFKSAQLSQADEFIDKLENKYDAIIGERGQKLSVGQKQRLAIARAFQEATGWHKQYPPEFNK